MFLVPYIKKISGDIETPITLYQKYVLNDIGFLLESREQPKGRYSFIAKNPFIVIKAKGEKTIVNEKGVITIEKGKILNIIKKYISKFKVKNNSELPFVGGAVGTVGYDLIRQYEKLPDINKDEMNLPDVHQMFIKELLVYDHFYQKIYLVILEEETDEGKLKAEKKLQSMFEKIFDRKISNSVKEKNNEANDFNNEMKIQSNLDKDTFMKNVKIAKKYIKEGDIFQVVLSQRWTVSARQDSFTLYRKLRQINPSAYLFYLNFGDYQVVGSSPEMLVEVRKNKIYTCPIAGTRKRGENSEQDEKIAEELKQDPKEISEHVMLVDLGRNDMGKVAKIGTVNLVDFMKVKYYSHVMHLVSLVEGEKDKGQDIFSILASFLPAGTLSGAPKIRAMEIIEELEPSKRGIYGGAVGYFGFDGDMDMCIAIRTMIINEGKIYMQAGAGIVADSDPEKEYEETLNKIKALIKAVE